MPTPKHKPPVETKVSWASAVAGLFGLLAAYVVANPDQFDWCPLWAKGLFLAGGTYFGTRLAGFQAPHTPRPELAPTVVVNGAAMSTSRSAATTATVHLQVVPDLLEAHQALDALSDRADQITAKVEHIHSVTAYGEPVSERAVPEPFTGDTPSPYEGGDVVQDPDAPPKRRTAKTATS